MKQENNKFVIRKCDSTYCTATKCGKVFAESFNKVLHLNRVCGNASLLYHMAIVLIISIHVTMRYLR